LLKSPAAAVVAAGRHLTKLFEGWIVATPDRRKLAVRITSYPEMDIIVPFDWNATAAEVTERVLRCDERSRSPHRRPQIAAGYAIPGLRNRGCCGMWKPLSVTRAAFEPASRV
jgi:hypothetical protein